MKPAFWVPVLASVVWISALAQQPPSVSASGASAPTKAPAAPKAAGRTAPTSPTARTLQDARPSADEGAGPQATPQIAIPLGRTGEKPVALKPGKASGAKWKVDDSVARCQAEKDPEARAKCAAP